MKRVFLAAIIASFAAGSAMAASCNAVGKDGKPLSGAAKTSFMKSCCTKAAIGKDGKPLKGAAKASFIKSCEKGG
jgi:hypothetical protein